MKATFLKDLRVIFRDRRALFGSMLVPVVLITVIAAALFAGGHSGTRLPIAVVDDDGGAIARELKDALAEHAEVVVLDRPAAERFVRDSNLGPVAVVLPAGLSDNYRIGRPSEVLLLTDPAQPNGLHAAKILLMLMEKKVELRADPFGEQMIVLRERNLTGNRLEVTDFEQNVPGFAIMFILFAVIFGTALGLHDERDWGTMPRLQIAPVGFLPILIGKLGARFVVGVLQMTVLLLWSHLAFGVSLGSSAAAMLLLVAATVLATVATGLVVAGLTRGREQAQPVGLALVIVLSGFGGLWWPASMAPAWMQTFGSALYTTWALRGMNDLVLRDRDLAALATSLAVLSLHTLLAFAVGLPLYAARQRSR